MFDTTIVKTADPYPQHISVTEKRAPTDESVRLLREMQQKSEDSIVESMRLDDNEFKGVVHSSVLAWEYTKQYVAVFSLNGRNLTARYSAGMDDSPEKTAVGLRDEIARVIANECLNGIRFDPRI